MTTAAEPRVRVHLNHGPVAAFLTDTTRQIDLEGAFRSGKTTAALWKVLMSAVKHDGINWLICRFGDGETQSILRPLWIEVCLNAGVACQWDAQQQRDVLPNGSSVYIYGLKASDLSSKYAKLRGRTLAGVYVDQAEELPHEIYLELAGRLSQGGMPHQMLLTPNPVSENHWLAQEFPEDNHLRGRKYYHISIYDNAHNLDPGVIEDLEQTYPPAHPKHRTAILGLRGVDVVGRPVYGEVFRRALHVRPLQLNATLPLYEAIDFGKHHPCVIWGQLTPYGSLELLGGILGQNLPLEDFVPVLKQYRTRWFADAFEIMSCCDPAGSHANSQGFRDTGVTFLRDHGINVAYIESSNAPEVRLATIERLMGYLRRRTPVGEAFGVNDDDSRWLRISPDGIVPMPFLADGLEAGYVWDELEVSVGHKRIKRPKKDGWFEHGMNCLEYLEINFGGAHPTQMQADEMAERIHRRQLRRSQQDTDEWDHVARRRGQRARRHI